MSLYSNVSSDIKRLRSMQRGLASVGLTGFIKTILSPRFTPVLIFRIAFALTRLRIPVLGTLFSFINYVVFGLEIAKNSEIGGGLIFPHTRGSVLGAKRIGSNVTIYHNVTIGARFMDFSYSLESRPVIGDDVILGSGCCVLGAVVVGNGARVAPNAVVIDDVLPGCLVGGVPAQVLKYPSCT